VTVDAETAELALAKVAKSLHIVLLPDHLVHIYMKHYAARVVGDTVDRMHGAGELRKLNRRFKLERLAAQAAASRSRLRTMANYRRKLACSAAAIDCSTGLGQSPSTR